MSDAMAHQWTVYIIDDDAAMRDSLSLMLGLQGYRTACFENAETFLSAYREDWSGCVVADLKLPGKSGLQLQAELCARGSELPFVIITGHGDVSSARAAFKADAVDFIEKPFEEEELVRAIEKGLQEESARLQKAAVGNDEGAQLAALTHREREVLALVGKGLHAKEIGQALGISPRTVEVHKANLMTKLGARNAAELVRFALAAEKNL